MKRENDAGRRGYLDYQQNPRGWALENLPEEAKKYLENCGAVQETPFLRLKAMNGPAIQLYRDHGIDLEKEMLEIRVCAQHHNGGIAVDANWQTSVPGLYVCGEAAGTFGRKRPGGTALNSTQAGSLRAAKHIMKNNRNLSEKNLPFNPILLPQGSAEPFQTEMTRIAAFQRDRKGMEALKKQAEAALLHTGPEMENIREGLLLKDMLLTQKAVLSAMLCAAEEKGNPPGVLMTYDAESRREPARPMPERDLWFERVWKKYREEHND